VACWQAFAGLAGHLTDLEQRLYGKASLSMANGSQAKDFQAYVEKQKPWFVTGGRLTPEQTRKIKPIVVRAEEVERDMSFMDSFVAVSDGVVSSCVDRSVILAGGSIRVSSSRDSLFFCDGTFYDKSEITNCLVIASGDVYISRDVTNCRIIARGKLRLG